MPCQSLPLSQPRGSTSASFEELERQSRSLNLFFLSISTDAGAPSAFCLEHSVHQCVFSGIRISFLCCRDLQVLKLFSSVPPVNSQVLTCEATTTPSSQCATLSAGQSVLETPSMCASLFEHERKVHCFSRSAKSLRKTELILIAKILKEQYYALMEEAGSVVSSGLVCSLSNAAARSSADAKDPLVQQASIMWPSHMLSVEGRVSLLGQE